MMMFPEYFVLFVLIHFFALFFEKSLKFCFQERKHQASSINVNV